MAEVVTTRMFRANLSDYLRKAHEGEEIVVMRHGRLDAVLGPVRHEEETDDDGNV